MQISVNIQYEQLINIIRHLPANQIAKIKSDLNTDYSDTKEEIEKTDFQKFLLNGPIMSSSLYKIYKENRKAMNLWRI